VFRSLCMTKVGGGPDWAPAGLWAGPFAVRQGGGRWLAGFQTEPWPTNPDLLLVRGEGVYGFLAQFDETVLIAWPAEEFLERVRAHATKPVKLSLWCNYESIRASINEIEERQRLCWNVSMSRAFRPLILPWPGAVSIDVQAAGLAHAWVGALESTLETYYRHYRPDRFFFDCHGSRRFPAISGETEEQYRAGWTALDNEMVRAGSITGHNPEEQHYNLAMRIHEHYMRAPLGSLGTARDLERRKPCAVGSEFHDWPLDPERFWSEVKAEYHGTERVHIVCARSSAAFGLYGLEGIV